MALDKNPGELIHIYRGQLQAILAFMTPNKILYGSDFPYVSIEQAKHFMDLLDQFITKEEEGLSLRNLRQNANAMFGW
jgi:6-methylsalicylate decarboxylase